MEAPVLLVTFFQYVGYPLHLIMGVVAMWAQTNGSFPEAADDAGSLQRAERFPDIIRRNTQNSASGFAWRRNHFRAVALRPGEEGLVQRSEVSSYSSDPQLE